MASPNHCVAFHEFSDNSQNNLLHHFIGRQSDTNRSFPSLFQTRPTSSTRFTFSLALFAVKPLKNSLSPQQTSRVRSSATNSGSTRLKHKLCREGCGSIKMAPKTQPGNHGTFTPLSPRSCQNHLNLPQMPSGGGGWGRVLLNEATGEPAAVKPGLFLTCVPVSGSGAGLGGLFIDADRRARQVLRGSANTVGTAAPHAGGDTKGTPPHRTPGVLNAIISGQKKTIFGKKTPPLTHPIASVALPTTS